MRADTSPPGAAGAGWARRRRAHVPAVGDTLRDLQAGAAVGCAPHLVLTGKAEKLRGQPLPPEYPAGTQVHTDVSAFADWLLLQPQLSPKGHAKSSSKARTHPNTSPNPGAPA